MNQKAKKKKKFNRFTGLTIAMMIIFTGVLSRLTFLQIVKADDYKEKANKSSIREIPEFAPRGIITDSQGNVLADNVKSYMVVYNETEDSKKEFFDTMTKVFSVLDENKDATTDDFELKIYADENKKISFGFEFRTEDDEAKKWQEIRFKKDRGFDYIIKQKLYEDREESSLTEAEKNEINKELLKITPEQVFYKLIKDYRMYQILRDGSMTEKEMDKEMKNKTPEEIVKMLQQKLKIDENKLNALMASDKTMSREKFVLDEIRKYLIIKDTIKMQSYSGYKPVIVARNIKESTAFIFYQRLNELSGIDINTQPIRRYPFGDLGSAFIGYISKINAGSADKYEERGYDSSTDYIGIAGLESAFEDKLRGSKGGKIVKLNRQGRVIQELGNREAYPGQNLQLTINKDVQRAAELALDQTMLELQKAGVHLSDGVDTTNANRGAAVVVDVNTGGIIALASRPGYDPNIFAVPGRLDEATYKKFFDPDLETLGAEYIKNRKLDTSKVSVDSMFKINPKYSTKNKVVREDYYDVLPKPLYNYATMALTQPGSTFKPLSAIAGLQEGVIYPKETIVDQGVYTKNNFGGKCWKYIEQGGSNHGAIDVTKAIQVSCNYFFYEVGDRLMGKGYDKLAEYAWKFGLGVNPKTKAKASTGIEINENFGQTANRESIRILVPRFFMPKLVASLAQPDAGRKYEGIDIVVHEGDSEEVEQIKTKLYDASKEYMQYRNEADVKLNRFYTTDKYRDIKFIDEVSKLLNDLAAKDPTLAGKIDKADINYAIQYKILPEIYSGNAEITTPANVYNAAIGQGYNNFTPLQLANYMATVVNGGKRYKLHLVDKFTDPYGKVLQEVKPEVIEDVKLSPATVATVIEGMKKVTEDGGTAATTFEEFERLTGIKTGGKTGSATFRVDQQDFGREAFGVYVGFAPLENPQIAVSVVIFDGAHGGFVAPVARSIFEAYFKQQILSINPQYQFMVDFTK